MTTQTHIFTSQMADLEPGVCQVHKVGVNRGWRPCLRVNGKVVWKGEHSFRNRDQNTPRCVAARDVALLVWHYIRDDSAPEYLLYRMGDAKVRTGTLPNGMPEWTPIAKWARDVATDLLS
jgi:hypothetical protein